MANQRVFVSYRRLDQPNDVDRLTKTLERKLGSVNFVDAKSIEHGVDFASRIAKALADCEVLIAIIGPRWEELLEQRVGQHDFVRIEVGEALKRGIPVIPVLLNRSSMPDSTALPDDLGELTKRQKIDVARGWFGHDGLKTLVWTIRSNFLKNRYKGPRARTAAFRDQTIIKDCEKKGDESAALLAEKSELLPLNKGVKLYPIDTDGRDCLYFVLSGGLYLRAGGWFHKFRLNPGEVVGEFPVLMRSRATYAAEVTAREPSILAWVREEDFERIADANPDLWRSMGKTLVKRLIDSNSQRRAIEIWATVATGAFVLAMFALIWMWLSARS